MNLKEAFRYQNFLDNIMRMATSSISSNYHALKVTKIHLRSKANPDAVDETEEVMMDDFYPNDNVIQLIKNLITERERISTAIGLAKASVGFDIDAAIEANKFRQQASNAIRCMLKARPTTTTEQGRDYKFNVEGNQTSYYYDIEVSKQENFDRSASKSIMRELINTADRVSTEIDEALINTQLDFIPQFDVNDTFDDIMTALIPQNIQ